MSERHEVTIAREEFLYEPLDRQPSRHWRPGVRIAAYEGDQITVGPDDYARGVLHGAFVGVEPPPTHTVTVAVRSFRYTPVPFPRARHEGNQASAELGQVIAVAEADYERGMRLQAFAEAQAEGSKYGRLGDPPLSASSIEFANWVRAAGPDALGMLLDDLAAAAGDDQTLVGHVAEIRRLLTTTDAGGSGDHLMFHLERIHELARHVTGADQRTADDELRDLVLSGQITNPDALKILLGAIQR